MATADLQAATAFLDCDMPQGEVQDVAGGIAAVFSARLPGKTSPNEDAAAVIPLDDRTAVIVVADGLGGSASGDQASRLAVEALIRSVEPVGATGSASATGEQVRTAILDGFEQANRDVQSLGGGAATTLAVVEIHDGTVRPYHVGDSAILVTGQRGRLKLQTICHSPVGYAVEAGVLDELEAMYHDQRHVVSNVIGRPDMRIEIGSPLELAARDTLLVATDGLFDNLHLPEIVERLRKGSLPTAVDELAVQSRQRMLEPIEGQPSKPDDLTLVAFRLR
jgi:serine/threonine protein phosphatase PrpC